MHYHDIHAAAGDRSTLSFEFFPPRSAAAAESLQRSLEALAPLRPDFVSVTYGAGGGRRDLTTRLVDDLGKCADFDPVPHLTCVGHRESEVLDLLRQFARSGAGTLLALRGDPLLDGRGGAGDFAHAIDLIRCIRRFNESGEHPDPRGFAIGAACFPEGHPDTPNRLLEMDRLKAKVDAGVDFLITQAFFDNRDFHDFRDRCRIASITVPILAGILPLTSRAGMEKMAALAGGMRYPASLLRALARADGDPAAFRRVAIHHAAEQCSDLLDRGVDGIHLYTLNQSLPILELCSRLGIYNRSAALTAA